MGLLRRSYSLIICGCERVKLVNSSLPSRWNSHLLLSFFSCSLLVNTNVIKSLVFTRDAFYVLKWLDQIFKSVIVNLLQLCSFMVRYCLWRVFSRVFFLPSLFQVVAIAVLRIAINDSKFLRAGSVIGKATRNFRKCENLNLFLFQCWRLFLHCVFNTVILRPYLRLDAWRSNAVRWQSEWLAFVLWSSFHHFSHVLLLWRGQPSRTVSIST